jgi:hypothetical protein
MRPQRIGNPETLESLVLHQFYLQLRKREQKAAAPMMALLLVGLPLVVTIASLAR